MTEKVVTDTQPTTFFDELQDTLHVLRSTLIELLAAVGADPAKPQDLARRFGLNKNLTWKVSKIAGATDPLGAVSHIPGVSGMNIFLRALTRAGAPAALIDQTRGAARTFERLVKVHTGDRATLEIMVGDRLPTDVQREQDELSRKRAFQGNSGISGVRAKTQLALVILAPNADQPDMADLVQVTGFDQFQRLKPNVRWLLSRRERWNDDDAYPGPDVLESLDPEFPVEKGVPLLGEFCSRPIPGVEVTSDEGEDQYELPPGPVGNTAAFTIFQGQVARRVGAVYQDESTDDVDGGREYSELGCNLITPAEHLVFDTLVHRDFDWAMDPEFVIYSRMDGGPMHASARRERNKLTVTEPLLDLGWGLGALATPRLPKYPTLLRYVFERLAWNAGDFRALRFTITYPPIPTVAMLRAKLPDRG